MSLLPRLFPILLLLVAIAPARAQQTAAAPGSLTADALASAVIPPHDPADVAQRVLGVGPLPEPPTSATPLQVGDSDSFYVTNSQADLDFTVSASVRAVGEHIYLWVEDGARVDAAALRALAASFDENVYGPVRALWGSEPSPGIDGDPRIHALFASGMGPSVAGYYAGKHTESKVVAPTSNEREMFFFNLDILGAQFDAKQLEGIMAHEFQHMIRDNINANQDTWLDEGFSEFTELALGYDRFGFALNFLARPDTQLNTWSEEFPRAPNYGGSLLFLGYLRDRHGLEAVQALSRDPANGMQAVDNVLRGLGEAGADDFFGDWVLANFLNDPNSAFGYQSVAGGLPSAAQLSDVSEYPFTLKTEINQYASDYLVFRDLRGADSLTVQFDAPQTVRLVPTEAFSGSHFWYSNRGDASDMRLTRAFDLRGVERATLSYRAWYHLETLWDYGYLMVSADGGASWDILETAHTTSENPHNNAYGPGYSGRSDGWVEENVSLDAYAGQEILLRFETITDDAVNQPGLAIDDVRIAQIGYAEDFESGPGGWQPEGWLWIDNVLPQQVWVQAVQQAGREVEVTRWLAPAERAWTLPLAADVDQVVLAISPFAPTTTVPLQYALEVNLSE